MRKGRWIDAVGLQRRQDRGQPLPAVVVHHHVRAGSCSERWRQMNAIVLQKPIDVTAPAGGNRGRAKGVFQDQIPSNDPGKNLAQSRIAIRIGRSSNRNQRGEFRIAESRTALVLEAFRPPLPVFPAAPAGPPPPWPLTRSGERRVGEERRSQRSPPFL